MRLEKLETADHREADRDLARLHGPPATADLARLGRRLAGDLEPAAPGEEIASITLGQFEQAVGRTWMMGARVALNSVLGRSPCRLCGCWELEACDHGCAWAEPGLCTACSGPSA